MADAPRIVLGIGNPGPEYAGTRHNVGFDLLDLLAEKLHLEWSPQPGPVRVAQGSDADTLFVLLEPLAYVNRSGEALLAWLGSRALHEEDDSYRNAKRWGIHIITEKDLAPFLR